MSRRSCAVLGGGILGAEVVGLHETSSGVVAVRVPEGREEREYDDVVLCAGLHADRLARLAGGRRSRGSCPSVASTTALRPERRHLVHGLVHPVPDPRYPFLGVHLTPRVDGEVLVGPDAVLALARDGYGWGTVSPRDLAESPGYAGDGSLVDDFRTERRDRVTALRSAPSPGATASPAIGEHLVVGIAGPGRGAGR